LSWETIRRIVWTGVFAIAFTAAMSGLWAVLLLANLRVSPALPWSILVQSLALWAAWTVLGGGWGPSGSRAARRELLRAYKLPTRVLGWAVVAGLLCVAALAGLWIVLHRLVATPSSPLPDTSRYPALTVGAVFVAASISGGVSEETGFRGYFQGSLERAGLGWGAPLIPALVMAPLHALTQGFAWPNLLFYMLVDTMLGALAFLTGSIRPGVIVHALGLLVFFTLIWPGDASRPMIATSGPDRAFWLAIMAAVLFGALSLAAFTRLARLADARLARAA
jgi:membrane protease YdiL (CAAX protease family)